MEIFKKIINHPLVNLALRLLVGTTFIVAGVAKITDTGHFAKEITNYNLMPLFSINLMAMIMPWLELISGLLLIFGVRLKANSLLISFMLVLFILSALSAIARGLDINCGCFGKASEKKLGWSKVLENSGLLIASVLLFFSNPSGLSFDSYIQKSGNINIEPELNETHPQT